MLAIKNTVKSRSGETHRKNNLSKFKTSNWYSNNQYKFGFKKFDKAAYENMVLAVRETEADVNFADSKTDWHFASTCLCVLSHQMVFEQFKAVDKQYQHERKETAQQFGYTWFMTNFAKENATVFKIECFRQMFLLNNENFDTNLFSGFPSWIQQQKNSDGDFVYFKHTDNPIVVRSANSKTTVGGTK